MEIEWNESELKRIAYLFDKSGKSDLDVRIKYKASLMLEQIKEDEEYEKRVFG